MSAQRPPYPPQSHRPVLPPISAIDEFIHPRSPAPSTAALPSRPPSLLSNEWHYASPRLSAPTPVTSTPAFTPLPSFSSPAVPVTPSSARHAAQDDTEAQRNYAVMEQDVDEIIRHCQGLSDHVIQHKYYMKQMPERAFQLSALDDMMNRANQVLNALLRLRKHQLTAENPLRFDVDGHNADDSTRRTRRRQSKRAVFRGRCQSCNISETPEWRRGPDGARTLCNACGLHYAKLARKQKEALAKESSSGLEASERSS